MPSSTEDEQKSRNNQDLGAALHTTNSATEEPVQRVISEKGHVDPDEEFREKDEVAATRTQSGSSESSDVESQKKGVEGPTNARWYHWIDPMKKKHIPPPPDHRPESREHTAGFFSKLTFWWMGSLMSVGYQRPLQLEDLPQVNPHRGTEALVTKLKDSFKKRREAGSKRPLVMAMYDTYRHDFVIGGLCQLTASLLQVLSPYVLRYLIQFATDAYIAQIEGTAGPSIGTGLGYVFGVTVMQIIQSLCINHFLYNGMVVGGMARGTLICVIFDKAMKLSGRARAGGIVETPPPDIKPGTEAERKWYQKMLRKNKSKAKKGKKGAKESSAEGWSNGRIVNLMSTDTHRIDLASGMFHMTWTAPVSILLTIALLLVNLTYSALAGIGILVIASPLLGRAIRSLYRRRAAINKITDQRVSLTQEILTAVRFVKYFGWEMSFLNRLAELRKREIRSIQWLLTIRNAINAVAMTMPVFASMLAFITYSLSQHVLDPAPVFSSLALFNSLRLPLNLLPLVLGQVTDAFNSVSRIQEFLLAEEAPDDVEWDYDHEKAVVLHNAEFTWERTTTHEPESGKGPKSKKQIKAEKRASKQARKSGNFESPGTSTPEEKELEPFKIKDIDFTVDRNELIAVIGLVGSGKSSLLAALAGDMRRTDGRVIFGASRAFCPQYAWIQNATVRDNIVFGKPFDPVWYEQVVEACALRQDLEMLPNGDQTEIGERGITVSGGQKQRLNIARAIYFNADVVIMDDPLSAVDAHVGRHIFDNAISGLLKDKCRILATHQLHVLHRCDRIVWMKDGNIDTIDTFNNLMASNEEFQQLLSSTAQEEEQEAEEKVNEDEEEEEKKDVKKKKQSKGPGLMQAEERAVKSVPWSTYISYVKASGSILVAPLVFISLLLSQVANIATSLWLSWWTADKFGYSDGVYIGVYAALGFAQALMMFLFAVALSVFGTQASKVMLRRALVRVMRAPMSFFDTTPLGRIINRFGKDIDVMDNNLADSMRMYFLTLGMIIAVFALIIAYFYYFAVALGPLFVLFLFATRYYRASAREIKRNEANLRSHVFSRFSESVAGMSTIRAYQLQDRFSGTLRAAIDDMDSAYYLTFSNQRWLSIRLDAIGNLLVFTTGILVVTSRFDVNPSTAGLVLSYVLSIVQMLQFTVRQLAEVENNMNATERIHYYGTQLEQEPPLESSPAVRPTWPEKGAIEFDNVQMRYRPGLPLVLRGFNLSVRAGERVGVVGRTGAGKSSIMSTLFRLVDLAGGSITIDGVDITAVGLRDLRSRLAIIPQDPTLFRGTIRSNLDPFGEHSDTALWDALRQSGLVDASSTPEHSGPSRITLDGAVEEEGLNFSLGQRQLMALARALVRGARIIVCDEATSSVDTETDAKIQQTILRGFRECTLLCIAHRLRTIIGYDRIIVMDNGVIAEVDTPRALFEQGGIFKGMCERSGIRVEDFDIAERGRALGEAADDEKSVASSGHGVEKEKDAE